MRNLLAVGLGGLAAIVVYWAGAVVTLLLLRGIPLGSAGGPPTPAEIALHLGLAVVATFIGALVTTKVATVAPRVALGAFGVLLAIGALVGFGKSSSQWPRWFGITVAGVCVSTVTACAILWTRRS
ncbi:MAG TPA: hypothetical protein VJ717_19180 [Gemmatimonadaceae bacterium]|nr:hypothetical protein [Gemmatimonadaceae bacterium]